MMKRLVGGIVLASLVAVLAGAGTAGADANFRTQRIPLSAVTGAPLKTGFVVDIHANGPQIFARERYVLVGVSPDTAYQVRLQLFAESTTCATNIGTVPTVSLQSSAAGNATGDFVFRPADAPHNVSVGIIWEITTGGTVAYTSPCVAVTTD